MRAELHRSFVTGSDPVGKQPGLRSRIDNGSQVSEQKLALILDSSNAATLKEDRAAERTGTTDVISMHESLCSVNKIRRKDDRVEIVER